jgi:tetratricopeptide (TPR) repeat protein
VVEASKLLAPGDAVGRRELGITLLSTASEFNPFNGRSDEDTRRDLERAFRSFGEALRLNADDPETLWGLGTSMTRLDKDLDLADTALKAAYLRVPSSAAIALSLANLKGHQGKPEEMIPYLRDTIRFANDLGTRRWATDTLRVMEENVAANQRIDEENRQQREAYEKQLAEYEKKYGKPKKKRP